MVGIAAATVANYFGVDMGVTRQGVFQILSTTMPAPSPGIKPSRSLVKRTAGAGRVIGKITGHRPHRTKPSQTQFADGGFCSAAIITSASPRLITSVASPMAWVLAEQAVTTVEL